MRAFVQLSALSAPFQMQRPLDIAQRWCLTTCRGADIQLSWNAWPDHNVARRHEPRPPTENAATALEQTSCRRVSASGGGGNGGAGLGGGVTGAREGGETTIGGLLPVPLASRVEMSTSSDDGE